MERWRHIEALFLEALQRPHTKREAYLHEACNGDPELHGEVASLLANDESGAFEPYVMPGTSELRPPHLANRLRRVRNAPKAHGTAWCRRSLVP